MKQTKIIIGCILSVFVSLNSFGQSTAKATEKTTKKHVKLEKSKVPTVVTDIYVKEYPSSLYENWYGYPAFVDPYDWYSYDPYLYTDEYPEYYIVEFTNEKIPHKVIYSKAGKKIATHKKLNGLPKAVSASISQGEYKAWKLTEEKEEIFKDGDSDDLKVYKVEVEKGKEKHLLFYQADGKLLKDKKTK